MKLLNYTKGKKTYFLGAIAILWGLYGWYMGFIDQETALQTIWGGLTALSVRHALN